ncbi:DUF1330 domain-containing protein [Salipiger mangrovisoli]|uniref:DUF1330 domain-containing protein n=1 Tax=Salipiger mangrovisoli TaxID=2865933 RepID=A0ABR9X1M3_9RHOB|nr:DUF1330 domain-containing protein [Salipiger mangrovisoli]MBE9637470.1 DUF1330 domain-containing protein [Salipiger mangrovisoli]
MKGYWLVLGTDVTDAEAQAEYGRLWAPVAAKYGARVRRGDEAPTMLEAGDKSRILLVEFADLATAQACYDDPDYQAARAFAMKAAQRELVIFAATLD